MRKYGLLVVSTLLVHCAGVFVYFFFIILRDGVIRFGEPTRPILVGEFIMAIVWTLVGIFFMIWATLELLNFRIGQKTGGDEESEVLPRGEM